MTEMDSNLPKSTSSKRKKRHSLKLDVVHCQHVVVPTLPDKKMFFPLETSGRNQPNQKWSLGFASSCLMCLAMSHKLAVICVLHRGSQGGVRERDSEQHTCICWILNSWFNLHIKWLIWSTQQDLGSPRRWPASGRACEGLYSWLGQPLAVPVRGCLA